MIHIKKIFRDFLLAQWLRLHPPNEEGPGLIPGGVTKIPHDRANHRREEKKQNSEGEVSWLFTLM